MVFKRKASFGSKKALRLISALMAFVFIWSSFAFTGVAYAEGTEGASGGFDVGSWMKYLPDDTQISEINIPGTHDAGTAKVTMVESKVVRLLLRIMGGMIDIFKLSADLIAERTGSTQSLSIKQQLEHGLRVFDIRLCLPRSGKEVMDLRLCHGESAVRCTCLDPDNGNKELTLGKCIGYAEAYLAAHPSETVIFQLSAEDDKDDVRPMLKELVRRADTKTVCYCASGETVPKLGKVRGKVVLIMDQNNHEETLTTYEMHYKDYEPDNVTPSIKGAILTSIVSSVSQSPSWVQKFFKSSDIFKNRKDIEYPSKERAETPQIIGTNITQLNMYGFWPLTDLYKTAKSFVKCVISSVKGLAGQVWNGFYYTDRPWPTWRRYGWVTMDDPKDTTIRHIIQSNYGQQAYALDISFQNAPSEVAAYLTEPNYRLQLSRNIAESVELALKGKEVTGKVIAHPIDCDSFSPTTGFPEKFVFTVNGKKYAALREGFTYTAHDPMADDNPGLWGYVNAVYRFTDYTDVTKIKVPPIVWIDDENGKFRPDNVDAFSAEIGTLTFRRRKNSGSGYMYEDVALTNTTDTEGPRLDVSGMKKLRYNGLDYWDGIYAYVPKYDENGVEYRYDTDLVYVTNYNAGSVYTAENTERPIPDRPSLNMHLKEKTGWVKGPDVVFVDAGDLKIRNEARKSFRSQGALHTGFVEGTLAVEERVKGSDKVKIDAVDSGSGLYETLFWCALRDDAYGLITQHGFELPLTLGKKGTDVYYERGINPSYANRYYAMKDVEVEVLWEDENNKYKLRPEGIAFGIEDAESGYSLDYQPVQSEDGWKVSLTVPAYWDVYEAALPVEIAPNTLRFPAVNGYAAEVSVVHGSGSQVTSVRVTYRLDDSNYVDIAGAVLFNDGDLTIAHDPKDTDIRVLRDGAYMEDAGIRLNVEAAPSAANEQAYEFRPLNKFPIVNPEGEDDLEALIKDAFPEATDKEVEEVMALIGPDTNGNGVQYTYEIEPKEMENYAVTTVMWDVYYTRLVTVSGTCDWENGVRPVSTQPTVILYRETKNSAKSAVAKVDCVDYQYSFEGLPIAAEDGVPYIYTVKAYISNGGPYTTTNDRTRDGKTGNVTANVTFHKVTDPIQEIVIPVKLELEAPASAAAVAEQGSFDFMLTSDDGSLGVQYLHLDKSNGFEGSFVIEDLPDYGKTYTFEVRQINTGVLPWWQYDTAVGLATVEVRYLLQKPFATVALDPDSGGKLVFTNVFEIPETEIAAQVVWKVPAKSRGAIPKEAAVTFLEDGVPVKTKKASEGNQWTVGYKVPLYEIVDGEIVPVDLSVYGVKAADIKNFTREIDGDPASGFVVTYTLTDIPRTGDENLPGVLLALMALSAAAGLLIRKRRRREN